MGIFFIKPILQVPGFRPLTNQKHSLWHEQKKDSANRSASGKAPDVRPIRDAARSERLGQDSQEELLAKPCHYRSSRSRVICLEFSPSKIDDQVKLRFWEKNEVSASYT